MRLVRFWARERIAVKSNELFANVPLLNQKKQSKTESLARNRNVHVFYNDLIFRNRSGKWDAQSHEGDNRR